MTDQPAAGARTTASAPTGEAGRTAPPSPFAGMLRDLDTFIARGLARVTGSVVAPYQSAIIRIGFSFTWLLFLLREWPHRSELYGPESPWSWDMARALIGTNHAFTVLMWSDSGRWFEVVYVAAIVSSVTLLLGWRTRTSAVLFMIGVLSLQNRSVFDGDGGDNVVHIMAIYLVFTRCGQVWSLDARRQRRARARAAERAAITVEGSGGEDGAGGHADGGAGRREAGRREFGGSWIAGASTGGRDIVGVVLWILLAAALLIVSGLGDLSLFWSFAFYVALLLQAVWWWVHRTSAPGEPRTVMEMIANLVHAGAMLVIVVEVCFVYATAGWYKIQGSAWEDGSALYYPLHINDFTPWPAFSHALASSGVIVMIISYGTVIVQVAFPFTLLNRRAKNTLLVLMMCEHAGIAVTLGLPFFSLAMISADAVFLPTAFLLWSGSKLTRSVNRVLPAGARRMNVPEPRQGEDSAASTLVG